MPSRSISGKGFARSRHIKRREVGSRPLPPPDVDITEDDAGQQRQQQCKTSHDNKAHTTLRTGSVVLRAPQPQPNPTGAMASDDGVRAVASGAGCSVAATAA